MMTDPVQYSQETLALAIRAFELNPPVEGLLYQHLLNEISRLIEKDFHAVVNILYRMDVSEEKIRLGLQLYPGRDAAEIITELVLERQAEKIRTRHLFNRDADIPDEDKW
jgi:hypothetical protein